MNQSTKETPESMVAADDLGFEMVAEKSKSKKDNKR